MRIQQGIILNIAYRALLTIHSLSNKLRIIPILFLFQATANDSYYDTDEDESAESNIEPKEVTNATLVVIVVVVDTALSINTVITCAPAVHFA